MRFLQWDKQWVGRKEGAEIRYWSGDSCQLFGGATLYRYNVKSTRTGKWWVSVRAANAWQSVVQIQLFKPEQLLEFVVNCLKSFHYIAGSGVISQAAPSCALTRRARARVGLAANVCMCLDLEKPVQGRPAAQVDMMHHMCDALMRKPSVTTVANMSHPRRLQVPDKPGVLMRAAVALTGDTIQVTRRKGFVSYMYRCAEAASRILVSAVVFVTVVQCVACASSVTTKLSSHIMMPQNCRSPCASCAACLS